MNDKDWSDAVANLAADALVDSGLVKAVDVKKASAVIAEEILVRLTMNDRPPVNVENLPSGSAGNRS